MPQRSLRKLIWKLIFGIMFVAAVATAGCFAFQSNQPEMANAGWLAADKSYGVTIDLTRTDEQRLPNLLSRLDENGLRWLRQPVLWANVEPAPDHFEWEPLDRVVAVIDQHNQAVSRQGAPKLKLIAVLYTTPPWARPPGTPTTTPPTQLSDFGRFARAFARRYGQQFDYYQVWHEPNLSVNWGRRYVDPPAYAGLLREAALNIRQADPSALILCAALAPTVEDGPLNLNEMAYLDRLYQANANQWFDIVAGQPYGFDADPADSPRPDVLNFRRVELLRRVMLAHDDAATPVWATAFGWNALPTDWVGRPSPWRDNQDKYDPPALQAQRTAAGLAWARQTWPWLGPVLAVRWDSAGLATDDPARGFALTDTPLLAEFRRVATGPVLATVGRYPADHPSGYYSPGWRTAQNHADIPRQPPRTLTIPFEGRRLDLTISRGDYRGYLWVTVDGQPANALPQNEQGRSYIVLYDPLRASESVLLAQNLKPGRHEAIIQADGGWGQWAIEGWTVSNRTTSQTAAAGWLLAAAVAVGSGLGLLWQFFPQLSAAAGQVQGWASRLPLPALGRRSEAVQVATIFVLALAFYVSPVDLARLLLVPLALAVLYRPDLGLALLAFSLSFFQAPKQLPAMTISLTETTLLLTVAGFGIRGLAQIAKGQRLPVRPVVGRLKSMDWAALTLLGLSLLSTLAATNFGVSMFEWRVLVLGSVGYYFLVRMGRDYGPPAATGATPPLRRVWRLLDALVAGAVLHSVIVLYRYGLANQVVLAEGVRRALSPFYASPNNLALYLDRVWPILLTVTVLPPAAATKSSIRRWLYGLALGPVSAALYLTFSRGALLVGLPAGVAAITLFHLARHRRRYLRRIGAVAAASLALIAVALVPLSQTARFGAVFDFMPGRTAFFRFKLWQASLNMLADHWLVGVGLNNFLYLYRTRYMLPTAWLEPNLSHPHNIILDYATRLGVGGVIILVWLQVAFWRNVWRLYQKLPDPFVLGLMGSMVVFLSHGLIDNSYFLVDLAFVFFLTAGVVQNLTEQYANS